jgi:hypothetical protein
MTEKRKPLFRIVAKNKDTRATVKIGSVWSTDYEGTFNISFVDKPFNEKEMSLGEFLRVYKDYYVAMYANDDDRPAPRKPAGRPRPQETTEDADF